MKLRDWLIVLFVGSIWGCSFMFNAVLIRELTPLWVSAGRVTIAAIVSWAVFFALRKPLPKDPVLYLKLGLLGVFSYAIPFTLFPMGQAHIPSGVTAIINALTPIMTVIVSNFWPGGERSTVSKAAGVLVGFAGATVLALPALEQGGNAQFWAISICLLATVLYAVTLNVARSFKSVEPTTIATIAISGAAVVSLPLAFTTQGVPHVTRVETWAAWLALGLFATALTFQIMYRVLPRIGATNFAANTFISPIFAIFLGVTLLGEIIYPSHIMGMLTIFLGLLLIDGRILNIFKRVGRLGSVSDQAARAKL